MIIIILGGKYFPLTIKGLKRIRIIIVHICGTFSDHRAIDQINLKIEGDKINLINKFNSKQYYIFIFSFLFLKNKTYKIFFYKRIKWKYKKLHLNKNNCNDWADRFKSMLISRGWKKKKWINFIVAFPYYSTFCRQSSGR